MIQPTEKPVVSRAPGSKRNRLRTSNQPPSIQASVDAAVNARPAGSIRRSQ
jgi:hypothetical protein